jgi:CheY-like chemotaxis protein
MKAEKTATPRFDDATPKSSRFPRQDGLLPKVRPVGILIMDDQELARALLGKSLQDRGFHVWLAENGKQAVEIYRRHRHRIQMVVLDVQLPGQDGPQTLRALQQINPNVMCCFLTGDLGSYSEEQLLRQGARRVFYKPVRLTELSRSLNRLTRRSSPEDDS